MVFDPFDLTDIEAQLARPGDGQSPIPHTIGRHVHHKARPDTTDPAPPQTGIDYLRLVEAQHAAELAERLRYSQLGDQPDPVQPTLPGTDEQRDPEVPA